MTTWNPAAERIFGWSKEEALGTSPPPFVPEDREEEFRAHLADVLGGQVRQNKEIERMHRDGSRIPLHLAYAPVRDEAGAVTGVMAVLSDISEFKETAEQLDQVQERYKAWLEVAPDIALTLDAEGRISTLNPAFERITGWTREAWIGRPFIDLAHPEDVDAVLENYQAAIDQEQPGTTEFRYKTAEGPWRWGAVLGRPVFEDDRIVDFFAIVRDITDQKQREEAKRERLRRELEIKRLRQEAQARKEVLQATAHELSNPLTPMRFQVELLRTLVEDLDEASARSQTRSLDVLERNLQRVSRLVGDLKDAARIEGRQLSLQPERVELGHLVPTLIDSYRELAADAGVSLEVELDTEHGQPVAVQADPTRLEQVLANLVANAIRFTPEGGAVQVEVTTADSEPEAGGARITVHDNGPGMTETQLEGLFEPFSQVHEPAAGEGGTGLGLYIAKGIVEAHGGRIWCESAGPGEGASFHVALPVGEG